MFFILLTLAASGDECAEKHTALLDAHESFAGDSGPSKSWLPSSSRMDVVQGDSKV